MAPNQSAVTPPLAKCLLPLLTLFTSTDDRLKLLYHRQKAKCLLPLLTFFTSTDGNTIQDDIGSPHQTTNAGASVGQTCIATQGEARAAPRTSISPSDVPEAPVAAELPVQV